MWQVFVISRRRTSGFISTFFFLWSKSHSNYFQSNFGAELLLLILRDATEASGSRQQSWTAASPVRVQLGNRGRVPVFISFSLYSTVSPPPSATWSITITVCESAKEQHMAYLHPQVCTSVWRQHQSHCLSLSLPHPFGSFVRKFTL